MKKRHIQPEPAQMPADESLYRALGCLRDVNEVRAFLMDLCTPAELEALIDRWRVVPMVEQGLPYREIHDKTAVSVTTIGRVARSLVAGSGGYRLALTRLSRMKIKRGAP
jgi:TrpR-related protein YerC/YecD